MWWKGVGVISRSGFLEAEMSDGLGGGDEGGDEW